MAEPAAASSTFAFESRQEYERRGRDGELSELDRERDRKLSLGPAGGDALPPGPSELGGGELVRDGGLAFASDARSSSLDASVDTSLSALGA